MFENLFSDVDPITLELYAFVALCFGTVIFSMASQSPWFAKRGRVKAPGTMQSLQEHRAMPKLTLLVGLCGSGKSYIAERLATETGARLFSDFLRDETKNLSAVVANLSSGTNCIVDECRYTIPSFREKILTDLKTVPNLDVEWICFENDRESADWNVRHRTNKGDPEGHLGINDFLSRVYEYPAGAQLLKITRIDSELND